MHLSLCDHTALPATRHRWFSRLYPGVLPVLIYRPRKDKRLSWPEHSEWTVGSELLRDDTTGTNCSVVMPHWAGVCERLVADWPRLEPATFWSLIWCSSHYAVSNYLVVRLPTMQGWVVQGLMSHRTHYRSFQRRVFCKDFPSLLQVKRPNQQHQYTEGIIEHIGK